MSEAAKPERDWVGILGFGIGAGLGTVALVGTYLRFWIADSNGWLITAGTFLIGAVLGALWAARPTRSA